MLAFISFLELLLFSDTRSDLEALDSMFSIPHDRLCLGVWVVRIVDPGSVGQRRDGRVGASCGVLDTRFFTVGSFDVGYDVRPVIGR
ncbi:hypothetical protein [Methanococcoides alaskense]|uniref:Diadenosine tetraphosphatase ApaH/serine/threonine PP2A family protein phosphatase n=1 Tax=Methanococcoides alaskense TaxID=325778 RepID=A0AA90Z7R8_9EURY|nr:hypothetical protein [Methanococcoides alaskense]MDA0524692.1 hypothetical protein [Methanococcoides alaskense]MDR6222381.1 diadenosine tetraphosphatase ApaH/serine/threonine PP2A family protein phosphatase [Methanococcoides alaskense]